jgi:hypothetical protein
MEPGLFMFLPLSWEQDIIKLLMKLLFTLYFLIFYPGILLMVLSQKLAPERGVRVPKILLAGFPSLAETVMRAGTVL